MEASKKTIFVKDYNKRNQFFFKLNRVIKEESLFEIKRDLKKEIKEVDCANFFKIKDNEALYMALFVKPYVNGLSKSYFSSERYLGCQAIQNLKIPALSISEREIRKAIQAVGGVQMVRGREDGILNVLIPKRDKSGPTRLCSSSAEEQKESRTVLDSLAKLKSGEARSFSDLYQQSMDDDQVITRLAREKRVLDIHISQYSKAGLLQYESRTILDQLQLYIETRYYQSKEIKIIEPRVSQEYLAENNLLEALKGLYKVIFGLVDQKKCVLWMHGDSNVGKSTLTEFIQEIFVCEKLLDASSQFIVDQKVDGVQPSIVTMNEINMPHFLGKRNLPKMKLLMEGKRYPVNIKHGGAEVRYQGCKVIVSSNDDPLEFLKGEHLESFKNRGVFVKMTREGQKGGQGFPLTCMQLANFFEDQLIQDKLLIHRVDDKTEDFTNACTLDATLEEGSINK